MPFRRRATGASGRPTQTEPTLVLAAAAGVFGSLDTALNIAFPDLVADLGIEVADLQWIVVTFVLSTGAALLAAGQLGDLADHRLLVRIGALCSIGALAACAMAPSYGWLLVARVAQGLSTALVMAGAPALAIRAAGVDGRGRALGVFSAATGFGAAVGPAIGGPLVSLGGWSAVFWFRVPLAVGLALLALIVGRTPRPGDGPHLTPDRGLDSSPRHPPAESDLLGAGLIAVGLAGVLLVIGSGSSLGFRSPPVVASVVVTILVVLAYRRRAASHPAPVLAPGLLTTGPVARAALLTVLANGSMFVAWLLVPALAVDHLGASPTLGGLVLAAAPLAMALVAPASGRWLDRSGSRWPVVAGLTLQTVGLALLASASTLTSNTASASASATMSAGAGIVVVAGAMALVGAGLGLFTVANLAEIMAVLPQDRQGTGGGLALMLRTVGIVSGVAGSAAVFDLLEPDRGFVEAFRLTTATSVVVALAAVCLALATRRSMLVGPA